MKTIKLNILQNEDIVLLIQGLNAVRSSCLNNMMFEFEIANKTKKYKPHIAEHIEVEDRAMNLITQLDDILKKLK